MLPSSSTITTTGIGRSFDNLTAFLSHRLRPWPTLTSSLSPPLSLSSALSRLKTNSRHFLANYALLVSASVSLFLLSSNPFALIVYALLALAWLLGYVFRDDPMVLYGRPVDDRTVLIVLTLGTLIVIWFFGMFFTGVFIGVFISIVHGVFKDTDGLFLDEDDAVSNGLIASGSRAKGFSV